TPWFLRSSAVGQPPVINRAAADNNTGNAPLTVHFRVQASDPDGAIAEYVWTYDDGTFSYAQNPTKIFPASGVYHVHLTVVDNSGNAVQRMIQIAVSDTASPRSGDGGKSLANFDLGFTAMPAITAAD